MKEIWTTIINKAFIPCTMMLYFMMIGISIAYGTDPYLWFDEAGQFWMSKGLNHDSAPLSQSGTLVDVIISNQEYNLDPGGFTILLYFWSMISNHYIWLRMLPFLFFLATIGVFIYLGYSWTRNKYIAAIIGFVPFLISMIYCEAFELRAYSMEVCGVAISIMAIDNLQKKLTYSRLILWSLLIAFFMTSRYSFIIVAFTVSTYVLYLIYKEERLIKQKVYMCIVYAIPLLIVLCYDYLFAMRFQNPTLHSLNYLPYINTDIKVLFHNSSLKHFFYIGLIVWIFCRIRKTKLGEKYLGICYVAIIVNVFFFVFSCLGMHPWDGSTTRCISMIAVVILAISALLSEIINHIMQKIDIKYIALAFVCLQCIPICKYQFKDSHKRENTLTEIQSFTKPLGKVYVDRWESPCMRYQYEYGRLKGLHNYPYNFTFIAYQKHGVRTNKISLSEWYDTFQPDLNELMDYDVLIAPELYNYRPQNSDNWESINNNHQVWQKKTL